MMSKMASCLLMGCVVASNSGNFDVIIGTEKELAAKCRHSGFRMVDVTSFCHHGALPFTPNDVPASFQRRCLARSPVEVFAEYLIQTVIQLSGAKKKPATYTTAPAGWPSPRWCSFWFVYVTGLYCSISIAYSVGAPLWAFESIVEYHTGSGLSTTNQRILRLLWKNAALYGIL